ncbi:poly(A) RNA polymerase, mitochondrial [Copidosoma floridanum]|uniref:poly(A) RNA polymerase, mitochondrial n=1 Tax=Copidosoma floridanum TaxID=29053 RepID=UPI000C6F7915|nr:poly(A) RNA polymerase, mitochondrial [Copidosoma floridanum]
MSTVGTEGFATLDGARSKSASTVSPKANSYIVYDELLRQRKAEASRSIIVQVQKENLCDDVLLYCSQFGEINKIFHYTSHIIEHSQKENKDLVFIEFKDEKHFEAALTASTHANHQYIIPACTPMLWFRHTKSSSIKKKLTSNKQIEIKKDSCKVLSKMEIKNKLAKVDSISEQILTLYDFTKLNDAGTRLRFFTAYQIERCFKSLFPNLVVVPFGSSVNTFGKQGCDLDLSLILDQNNTEKISSSLVYQTKYFSGQNKTHVKRLMETIADSMSTFLPGVSNVKKILEARVPIIKFDHLLCGVECDLSTTNMTAYYMSELLYIFGEMDWRVRPLVFTIRKWAESIGLTSKIPGPWISNFMLTMMVLFFLQQQHVLPSINSLKLSASQNDVRVADVHVDCTFLRDITKLPKTKNTDSLEKLLLDFFSYYSNFDFSAKAISLNMGKPVLKSENHPLYICNPLEVNLNVSRIVSIDSLHRLVLAFRDATWVLETKKERNHESKGLLSLFSKESIQKNWKESKKTAR